MDELVPKFESIGLSEQKAKESAKNKKLAPNLDTCINEAGYASSGCSKETGALLYTLASTISKDAQPHLAYIAKAIASGRLKTSDQVSAAIKYVDKVETINDKDFNEACGVGVIVSAEQIKEAVSKHIMNNRAEILDARYKIMGSTFAGVRKIPEMRWADAQSLKAEFDKQFAELLGPKDERDAPQKTKKKVDKADSPKPTTNTTALAASVEDKPVDMFEGEIARLHKPGENPQIKPSLMEEHLKATGGKVVTRFPPEPNGFLHIGHAKAINVNFGYAKKYGGVTYLRYDDTNPEAEEEKYFTSILDTVRWLGFEPWKVTYSSDYFQKLYDLAIELIKKDKAYVCQCTKDEIHANRGGDEGGPRKACVHRDRPIDESIAEFTKMKEGRYKENEAVLRMKMDLESGNPQFWDLIAYRVLYTPHHRTGSDWCVYPTYDYTHCLVDSFENITHSFCTLEFRQSRESYYWLVDALEVYKPVQWESGRLNVTNTIMSKRKLLKLVNEGYVSGWDDPRLFTLVGIRRRGVPAEAINNFVAELGVTTSNSIINYTRLDNHTRDVLDKTAPRLMALLDPLKITIENLPEDYLEEIIVPNKPRDPSMGEHVVPFTRTIYIDRSDFREQDSKDYFRLAPGKSVGLLHVKSPITCVDVKRSTDGKVEELICKYDNDVEFKKPKTYIQWVAESKAHASPVRLSEVRLYEIMFNHANPSDKTEVPGGYISDINPDSKHIITGAIAEVGVWDQLEQWLRKTGGKDPESMRWQFVRVGYFCVDPDSVIDTVAPGCAIKPQDLVKKLVINRTVTLKEDVKKEETIERKGGIKDPRSKR
ncbi:hypothetical protein BZG36_01802 [Bifiguratus adelaidae]|uniref:glutamine--tRNA ligase n=1 Tax=Bifiguratus adelaidae TaxID=1938954 RepID=A0A261Y284_9FUNG|nr:hypothetical protein BZG36_01802 [Bifiguratus adelaidae]